MQPQAGEEKQKRGTEGEELNSGINSLVWPFLACSPASPTAWDYQQKTKEQKPIPRGNDKGRLKEWEALGQCDS